MAELLLIGVVGKAHGLRGDVSVKPFNPASPLWSAGVDVFLVPNEGRAPEVDTIEVDEAHLTTIVWAGRGAKGLLKVRFEGCGGRSQAEDLRGCLIAVPVDAVSDADSLGDDEFYFHEVGGWRVETPDGALVGTVVRAVVTYSELFEVAPAGGGETFFVPVVGDIVVAIDRAAGRVVIDPPEGLVPE